MKLFVLSVVIGVFYAANAVDGFVSFIGQDQEFRCEGNDARWILPNRTQVPSNNSKFQIDTIPELESRLVVKNVNPRDIGPYRCVSDKVDKSFDLQIYYPLSIDDYTRFSTVKENEDVTLKCKSNGVPDANVQWYFENSLLVESANVKFTNKGASITLERVQPDQAGSYVCIVIQELGSLKNIQERNVQLIVEYGPKPLESRNQTVYGKIGESVNLECVAKSVPNSHFVWHRNGYWVYENVQTFNDVSRLKVELTSQDSFASYTCQASNNHGDIRQIFVIDDEANQPEISGAKSIVSAFFLIPMIGIFFF